MTRDVATVVPTTPLREALTLMRDLGVRHLPVLGDGRFLGVLDDRLALGALLAGEGTQAALEQTAGTVMTRYVPQVAADATLERVAHLLVTSRCDAVVVVDAEERLLGLVTLVDVARAVAGEVRG